MVTGCTACIDSVFLSCGEIPSLGGDVFGLLDGLYCWMVGLLNCWIVLKHAM